MIVELMKAAANAQLKNVKEKAIGLAIVELLRANGRFTNLELKVKLREDYPLLMWNQSDISQLLKEEHADMGLIFEDNGTFRTYIDPEFKKEETTSTTDDEEGKLLVGKTYKVKIKKRGWKTITPYKYKKGEYRCKLKDGRYRRYKESKIEEFSLVTKRK